MEDGKQLLINYRVTFSTEAGREVLKDLENFCNYNHPCFVRGEADTTAFSLGMRNVYLRIKKILETDLETKKQTEVKSDE